MDFSLLGSHFQSARSCVLFTLLQWWYMYFFIRLFKFDLTWQKRIVWIMCGAHCKLLFQPYNPLPSLYILEVLSFLKNNLQNHLVSKLKHTYNTRHRGDMAYPIHGMTLSEREASNTPLCGSIMRSLSAWWGTLKKPAYLKINCKLLWL